MKKTVLITGAASGIGKYIASQYSKRQNYNVIGMDKDLIDGIDNIVLYKFDLSKEDQVENNFTNIERIDFAVNCAGVSSTRKIMTEFSQTEIVTCWQENFLPTFNAMQKEIEIMKNNNGGKIINIASISGHIGMKGFLAYSTAKASIINMTKVAAIEQAEFNIKINSISPATVDTPMIRKKHNGNLRDYSNVYPTKNCGTVKDIYSIVEMLEKNEFITGSDIKLDGGMTNLFTI